MKVDFAWPRGGMETGMRNTNIEGKGRKGGTVQE